MVLVKLGIWCPDKFPVSRRLPWRAVCRSEYMRLSQVANDGFVLEIPPGIAGRAWSAPGPRGVGIYTLR
jgi:hypothetical protein